MCGECRPGLVSRTGFLAAAAVALTAREVGRMGGRRAAALCVGRLRGLIGALSSSSREQRHLGWETVGKSSAVGSRAQTSNG